LGIEANSDPKELICIIPSFVSDIPQTGVIYVKIFIQQWEVCGVVLKLAGDVGVVGVCASLRGK
jgi:hypothetical protein